MPPKMKKLSTGHGTLEGPLWDAQRGLLFADATVVGVRTLQSDGSVRDVVLHRRGIGGLALHQDSGVVIGGVISQSSAMLLKAIAILLSYWKMIRIATLSVSTI